MWWCCEVQPLRDGGAEPVHSGGLREVQPLRLRDGGAKLLRGDAVAMPSLCATA